MAKNRFQKGIENLKSQDEVVVSVSVPEMIPNTDIKIKEIMDPGNRNQKMKTNNITIYINDEIKEALDTACFKYNISRSKFINEILKQVLVKK